MNALDDPKLLAEFAKLGIVVDGDQIRVPKEVLEQARDRAREKARQVTYPTVPGTPPMLTRNGFGLAVSRGSHRPAMSLQALRDSRERGMLFRPIHRARSYQIRRLARPWYGDKTQVGLRVVHKDYHDRNVKPPEGFDKYIRQFERVLWRPMGGEDPTTLGTNLARLWEDLATINRPVVEPVGSILDTGTITQWQVHDGALIWPTLLFAEFWWSRNPGTASMLLGNHRGQLTTENRLELLSHRLNLDLAGAEYVCVQEGSPRAIYRRGDLLVAPMDTRTDVTFTGYPPSHVEEVIELAKTFMDSFDFSAVQLSKGSFAQQIIGLPWDIDPNAFNAFVDMWRESTQGVGRAGQPLFMPMPPGQDQKLQVVPLAPPINEMGFQALLSVCMSLATAVYRMHPSSINVRPWEGGSGHSLNQGSQTEEIGLAQEEGLQGDMEHLIDAILNPLAMRCHPDLRVVAWYGDYDAQKEAAIIGTRVQSEMTLNEARLAQGQRPKGAWLADDEYDAADEAAKKAHDDNPYNDIMPIAMAKLQAQVQKDAMQMQQDHQKELMAQQQPPGGAGPQGSQDQGGDEGGGDGYPDEAWAPMLKAEPRTVTVTVHPTKEYP